jgi:hypothetical protein
MKTRIWQFYISQEYRIALQVARKIAPCNMAFTLIGLFVADLIQLESTPAIYNRIFNKQSIN